MKQIAYVLFLPIIFIVFMANPIFSQQYTYQFKKPFMIKVDGEILNTCEVGHAAPWIYDFDSDGKDDLLVGYFGRRDADDPDIQGGKLLIFKNIGTQKNPKYKRGEFFMVDGKLGTVPSG